MIPANEVLKYSFFPFPFYFSGKFRKPAWTDRVLWKENQEKTDTVQLITYKSHDQYMTSDHRPVSALLSVDLQVGCYGNFSTVSKNNVMKSFKVLLKFHFGPPLLLSVIRRPWDTE
jgi:hypothetical protein